MNDLLKDLEHLVKMVKSKTSHDMYPKDCDLLIVGDGSGTTIETPCGFACVAYDVANQKYVIHKGCLSHGTNNMAEVAPYVHALSYDMYIRGINQTFKTLSEARTVQVVSDSELTVNQGNLKYSRNVNLGLWGAIDKFVDMGYSIFWNHVRRNSNPVNALCDQLAGEMRKKMVDSCGN